MKKVTIKYFNSGSTTEKKIVVNSDFGYTKLLELIIKVSEGAYRNGDYIPCLTELAFLFYILKDFTQAEKTEYLTILKKEETDEEGNILSEEEVEWNWDSLFEKIKNEDFMGKLRHAFGEYEYDYAWNAIKERIEYLIGSGSQLSKLQGSVDNMVGLSLKGESPFDIPEDEENEV